MLEKKSHVLLQRHRHRSHRKEEPLRAIQQPHEALQAAASWQATQEPASAQLQKAKKVPSHIQRVPAPLLACNSRPSYELCRLLKA